MDGWMGEWVGYTSLWASYCFAEAPLLAAAFLWAATYLGYSILLWPASQLASSSVAPATHFVPTRGSYNAFNMFSNLQLQSRIAQE